jgi:hypothetical protein
MAADIQVAVDLAVDNREVADQAAAAHKRDGRAVQGIQDVLGAVHSQGEDLAEELAAAMRQEGSFQGGMCLPQAEEPSLVETFQQELPLRSTRGWFKIF